MLVANCIRATLAREAMSGGVARFDNRVPLCDTRSCCLSGQPCWTMRAEVAELADAHGSGPCTRKGVGVRVPSSAPASLKLFFPDKRTGKPYLVPIGAR